MKSLKLCLAGLLVLVLGLLLAQAATAQTGLEATPAQLAVAGARGAVETRTLLLRANVPIAGLQIIPLDLTGADGVTILPAAAIHPTLPAGQIAAGGLLTVPVRIDLQNAASGEFDGELLLSYQGGIHSLPVKVTVKDPWPVPLVVLIVGVALGVSVSAYRAQGRPRDEMLVRVGQLRAQMRADADLVEPFRTHVEAWLVDVEAALQVEGWEEAQRAAAQAEALWGKWRKGRADWLAQLGYQVKLAQRLDKEPGADTPYLQAVRHGMEDAMRDAPDMASPDNLRERLEELAQQANRYLQLQAQLGELNRLRAQLPAAQAESWRIKVLAWQKRLHELSPADQAGWQALQDEVGAAGVELPQLLLQHSQMEAAAKGLRGEATAPALIPLSSAPSARALSAGTQLPEASGCLSPLLRLLAGSPAGAPAAEAQAADARVRLRLFTWGSYIVAVALLAGAGFGELYVVRPAFGAAPWGDYFALLAWGFGAEATRAAVADMVRGWGLPGVK